MRDIKKYTMKIAYRDTDIKPIFETFLLDSETRLQRIPPAIPRIIYNLLNMKNKKNGWQLAICVRLTQNLIGSSHISSPKSYTILWKSLKSFRMLVFTKMAVLYIISIKMADVVINHLKIGPHLTRSTPAVPNCCCSRASAPYWSNPPFFNVLSFGRSGAQFWAAERPNVRY